MQETVPGLSMNLADYGNRVSRTLEALHRQQAVSRLWSKDVSLWRQPPDGSNVIAERLGWLELPAIIRSRVPEIRTFAEKVKERGFRHAVLMGMGGSSLSPEVSKLTFGSREGYPELLVLDSTVPAAVLSVEQHVDLSRTVFIVSTKSGTTIETLSAYRYFYEKLSGLTDQPSEHFGAITDPGTPLQVEAAQQGFRGLFLNPPDIGGRYSALSYFGLVPAAVIGADIELLLERSAGAAEECRSEVHQNPGVMLGTAIAELALAGRDKMTMILSAEIASLGSWVEQLVAESTGKLGRGILPVDDEPLADPDIYGCDRFFVYFRLENPECRALDEQMRQLELIGHPVIQIDFRDIYDIGRAYFLWETATAVASAVLAINAFDQPNVKESKDITGDLLDGYAVSGLPTQSAAAEESGIGLFCDAATRDMLDGIRSRLGLSDASLTAYLRAYLNECRPGNYVALLAFVHKTPEIEARLQQIRGQMRDRLGAATTLGYGPRFLHSTGQLHKGGPNEGLFIQFTADDDTDVPIPGVGYGFSALKQAQAAGDAIALQSKGRLFIRIHLGDDLEGGLNKFADALAEALEG